MTVLVDVYSISVKCRMAAQVQHGTDIDTTSVCGAQCRATHARTAWNWSGQLEDDGAWRRYLSDSNQFEKVCLD